MQFRCPCSCILFRPREVAIVLALGHNGLNPGFCSTRPDRAPALTEASRTETEAPKAANPIKDPVAVTNHARNREERCPIYWIRRVKVALW